MLVSGRQTETVARLISYVSLGQCSIGYSDVVGRRLRSRSQVKAVAELLSRVSRGRG